MKHFISTLFLSLIIGHSFAQKCKETVDPITNDKKIEFVYTDHVYGDVKLQMVNGKVKFSKVFRLNGSNNIKVSPGLEFAFKLENGDVLKFKSTNESAPKIDTDFGGTIYSYFNFDFDISKDDLAKLGKSPVIFIRAPKIISDGFNDFDKDAAEVYASKKALMKGASCMSAY
jgi:hypothetical protein